MIGHDRVWQVVFASSLPGLPGGSHGSQGSTKRNIDADAESETHHRESRAKSEGRRIHTRKQALPSLGIRQYACDRRFVCHAAFTAWCWVLAVCKSCVAAGSSA